MSAKLTVSTLFLLLITFASPAFADIWYEDQDNDGYAEHQWPTANIVDIQTLEFFDEGHTSSSTSAPLRRCFR